MEMNVLKTFSTVWSGSWKVFWEINVPKNVEKCWKITDRLKMLKGVLFLVKLQTLNLQLYWKINYATSIFQLICLPFNNNCSSKKTSKERVGTLKLMYIMLLKVHCSSISAVAAVTFDWLMIDLFWKTRMNHLNRHYLLSSATNKKERETWKVQRGSSQWKVST